MKAPRGGCCADWPKPCSYHEGWEDGFEASEQRFDLITSNEVLMDFVNDGSDLYVIQPE